MISIIICFIFRDTIATVCIKCCCFNPLLSGLRHILDMWLHSCISGHVCESLTLKTRCYERAKVKMALTSITCLDVALGSSIILALEGPLLCAAYFFLVCPCILGYMREDINKIKILENDIFIDL